MPRKDRRKRRSARSKESKDIFSLYTKSRAEGFGSEVKRRIIIGTFALSSGYQDAYYSRALKVRTLIKRDFDEVFKKCDTLLTPCAPTPAFKFGELQDPLTMYLNDLFTIPSSLAGVCASSVPAGFTAAHLPVGVQFICGGYEEEKLIKVSKAFEDIAGVL
jgi:aspartyl-tRNA(Asn)/glutamyl-tRNA(Gln) amidotransferase subunit A